MNSCCCKFICWGCNYANHKRELERKLESKCPFCRQTPPKTREEAENNYMKRLEANDPFAMIQLGVQRKKAGDLSGAFEYYTKAAELGNLDAHYNLSLTYQHWDPVEENRKAKLYHLEVAAIGGHADARYDLGYFEAINDRQNRAIKHWIIAANQGCDKSLDILKKNYANDGSVTKDEFASALRGHHAAVKATKSHQRKEAEAARQMAEAATADWQI